MNSIIVVQTCTASFPGLPTEEFEAGELIQPWSSFYWPMLWAGLATDSGLAPEPEDPNRESSYQVVVLKKGTALTDGDVVQYDGATGAWRSQPSALFGVEYGHPLGPYFASIHRRTSVPSRAVFLGSSTTYGAGATSNDKRWVDVFNSRMQSAYPSGTGTETPVRLLSEASGTPITAPGIQCINGGIAGTTSANYCSSAALYGLGIINPDVVFHMIGSNDSVAGSTYISPNQYKVNVAKTLDDIDALSASGTPVCHVLVHSFRRFGVTEKQWKEYGDALLAIANTRKNVMFIDMSQTFEGMKHISPDPYDVIAADITHPSDTGHAIIADLVAKGLRIGMAARPSGTAGDASTVNFTPAGGVAATNVQGALAELGVKQTSHKTEAGAHAAGVVDYAGGPYLPASTVEAAIDALDQRDVGVGLADGTDCNTLVEPGIYYRGSSTGVTAASNYPSDGWAGTIQVMRPSAGTNPHILQIAYTIYSSSSATPAYSQVHYRTRVSGTWNAWSKITTARDLIPKNLPAGTDLNTLVTSDLWSWTTSGATTALNWPIAGFQGHIEVISNHVGNVVVQRATLTPNQSGFPSGTSWVRALHGTTWGPWHISNRDMRTEYLTGNNVDLNTLQLGRYFIASSVASAAGSNAPSGGGDGWLDVTQRPTGGYRHQTYTSVVSPFRTWDRNSVDSGVNWSAWVENTVSTHVSSADPHTQYQTRAATVFTGDLDTLLAGGDYAIGSAATNVPFAGGGHLVVIEGNSTYRAQIMVGREASNQVNFWRRIRVGTTWLAWQQVSQANTATTYTQPQTFSFVGGSVYIERPDAPADQRKWRFYVGPTGTLAIDPVNDGNVNSGAVDFQFNRNGSYRLNGVWHHSGVGTPETFVTAPVGSVYTDTAATSGVVRWVKFSGTGATGWRAEYGDSGWRRIATPTGWADVATSPQLDFRRINETVWFRMRMQIAEGNPQLGTTRSGNTNIIDLPTGFLPTTTWGYLAPATINSAVAAWVNNQSTRTRLAVALKDSSAPGVWTIGDSIGAHGSWLTEQVWPTVLPGTPVTG